MVPSAEGIRARLTSVEPGRLLLEATGDAVNWNPVYTNGVDAIGLDFVDEPMGNLPRRFYRAGRWE